MRASRQHLHAARTILHAALFAGLAGCTSLGPPLDLSLPGSPGFRGPDPTDSPLPGGAEDELGRDPAVRGVLVPTGRREGRGGSVSRTDAEPLPIGWALKRHPGTLDAKSGAVLGGLFGIAGGITYGRPFGPGLDAASILAFGTLWASYGALIGSLGDDPTGLVWPLEFGKVLPDPAFRPLFRGTPPRAERLPGLFYRSRPEG